jgi:hypothetical protein
VETLTVSSEDAAREWVEGDTILLHRAEALFQAEDVPGVLLGGRKDSWVWVVTRELRRFRDANTIEEYLRVREELRPTLVHGATRLGLPYFLPQYVDDPDAFVSDDTSEGVRRPFIFIVMPFGAEWSDRVHAVMNDGCHKVREAIEIEWQRADQIPEPGRITAQILASIQRATVILGDLTGNNPNVMYELGYADALGKPIVVLNQDPSDSPFDLKDLRQIRYSLSDLEHTENELVRALTAALSAPPRSIT